MGAVTVGAGTGAVGLFAELDLEESVFRFLKWNTRLSHTNSTLGFAVPPF